MVDSSQSNRDKKQEATEFPSNSGKDMKDDEFHEYLRQKVSDSLTPE